MIPLDDKIQCIIYQQFALKADLMVVISSLDDGFQAVGRVRFYADNDPFSTADRKSWFKSTVPTIDAGVEKVRGTAASLAQVTKIFGFEPENAEMTILRREEGEDYLEFFERFKKLPFVHSKELGKTN